jgi:hypothetical protein
MRPWPYWLDPKGLRFSTRTRNCLIYGGLLGEAEQLSKLTYDRLFNIRSMGVVSILEFACVAESALEQGSESQKEPRTSAHEELFHVITEPWPDQFGPADPRFSDLIPTAPYATIFEILDGLTSGPDADGETLEQLIDAMPEIRERVSQIRALPLERQLSDFLRSISRFDGERLAALEDRLGWSGSPAITLEEAGSRLGITRERFRQLQERVVNRLQGISFPVYLPALDTALPLVTMTAQSSASISS